ncbi:3'5'-cyclic nucleotide phosphodiesterase [Haematococcus lacustris]|uniref:Phosphodiesterase n=1 Tax=Haematococcus lacustris TaxID=44745 RepID=A0A699YHH3_HAELA|nr:3'5'-cyclic nucleotide phosphodiesterase [Haematococcus lacustris]
MDWGLAGKTLFSVSSARQGPDPVSAAAPGAGDTLSLSLTPRSKSTLRGALRALKAALNPSSPSSQGSPGRVQHGEDEEDEDEGTDVADRSYHGTADIGMPQCAPSPSPAAAYHAKTSRVVAMPPTVVEELHSLLEAAYSSWTYDSFALAAASQGHPLSALLYFLLHRSGLMTRFRLDPLMTARFARALEAGYQDQPYHNKIHAADVLQTLHVVLTRGGLVPGYADPLTLLACLLAGAAHDLQHSGLTNDFLVATEHPLALLYNDKSPAENHHLATLFSMLRCPELALLAHLPKQERDKMRKIIIELIMGTDMKQHFTITSSFANLHRLPAERVALKISDLGSSAETFEVNRRWVAALQDEFFAQGDQEKAAGLPVSALMDRDKPGAASVASQFGWYDFVAIPLFYNFTRVFPQAEPLMSSAMATYR